ncbi:MAG: YgiQ family radical SAM protein [Deltaproteobacteria bacterium]|jgi:uncharacterized radical SAM protein YgiQ|nr:YgiQ family radical SAM protein [Deltaproteobacteria bacterium]
MRRITQPSFLPVSPDEIRSLGWGGLDVLLVSGDAYVDHPAFAMALLGRWLVEHGLRTAVLPQPPWTGEEALESLRAFPRPRLFAGIGAGAVDSMLAHYTAFRRKRHDDAYTPGGKSGARPNRASLIYAGLLRRAFPGLPIILGGLEASLRRVSHYDFWSDSLRQSILSDSKADLLLCGMAEYSLLRAAGIAGSSTQETANCPEDTPRAATRRKALSLAWAMLPGAVTLHSAEDMEKLLPCLPSAPIALHGHNEVRKNPALLLENTLELEKLTHQGQSFITQKTADYRTLLLAPPPPPLAAEEMDKLYALPYSRLPHPIYKDPVPAWEMIRTSITTHRGCGGGCSFCSLALHQGRRISSRSKASILAEAGRIAMGPVQGQKTPPWAGSISDVGGPSSNMWRARCSSPVSSRCRRNSCLHPAPCRHFIHKQKEAAALLDELAALPGLRHVRVSSGLRFDLAVSETEAMRAFAKDYAGGQLKIAPEHINDQVLELMRKPPRSVFEQFLRAFAAQNHAATPCKPGQLPGKKQYVILYLISAFPGCTLEHMRELADWLRGHGISPKQTQCFIPTPGTVATAMYHAGTDSAGRPIYVAKSDKERLRQHHILLKP